MIERVVESAVDVSSTFVDEAIDIDSGDTVIAEVLNVTRLHRSM